MWEQLKNGMISGDIKSLSRGISLIENEALGFEKFLESLLIPHTPVIGITGPPGAGKSTLTDALLVFLTAQQKKTAVLCVDPSSPFNMGALLGDRIRMNQWYNNPNVFIRSLATKGSLGGLHPKIIEITDLLKVALFDYIIIETVGVGQSEIEIAGLADITIVVLVPESGDEIQSMKAGLMEIADIFVVNKSDRPDADLFTKNLDIMLSPAFRNREGKPDIIKTVASEGIGIEQLFQAISNKITDVKSADNKYRFLAEKAYQLIRNKKMKNISKQKLFEEIKKQDILNVYTFAAAY